MPQRRTLAHRELPGACSGQVFVVRAFVRLGE